MQCRCYCLPLSYYIPRLPSLFSYVSFECFTGQRRIKFEVCLCLTFLRLKRTFFLTDRIVEYRLVMSYRRKAPAAKTLTPRQQLGKLCNAYSGNLTFQSHNSMALLAQLHKHEKAYYDQFAKNATVQRFVPAWAVRTPQKGTTPTRFTLPLPSHFINTGESADDFEPRAFFLEKAVSADVGVGGKVPAFPRCGRSGLFFSREEVVDNLQAAAADLNFSSPFWIHKDHPGLESGYLQLKEGNEAIVISLTASVIGLGDVETVEVTKLHPSLHTAITGDVNSASGLSVSDEIPLGVNALTGVVTKNPFICSLPNRGLWLSQDQLLHHNIKFSRRIKHAASAFTLVEIDQWELFNADQLQVPGRLGLRQSLNLAPNETVFQPV
ncbi:hypothetical protein, conserved [Leishmania tarentolae]|uniref:Uncharacterized protein n=1 Tax=Leishmania tarentolae TaxID=5689 RepID=A0A640KSM7_LEITA|nr:hypothetical protein, conserved [Leishmania tarentolae]